MAVIDPWAQPGGGGGGAGLPDPDTALRMVQDAPAPEAQAHRDMLGEVFGMLRGQGVDVDQLAQLQFGLPDANVNQFAPDQLVQLTIQLAQTHPELIAMVVQRFPEAMPLLASLTGGALAGGGGEGGGGGLLGGLLGRVLGGGG
jgi:hypothetical protein